MSVILESIRCTPEIGESVSNGAWLAIVNCGRAFDDSIPGWNGCHDGQTWTPSQLTIMADRIEQIAKLVPILRDLANAGGVKIS